MYTYIYIYIHICFIHETNFGKLRHFCESPLLSWLRLEAVRCFLISRLISLSLSRTRPRWSGWASVLRFGRCAHIEGSCIGSCGSWHDAARNDEARRGTRGHAMTRRRLASREMNHARVTLSFQQPKFQHLTTHQWLSYSHFKFLSLFQVSFWNVGCRNYC